jgi:hypothetical protein
MHAQAVFVLSNAWLSLLRAIRLAARSSESFEKQREKRT